MQHAYIGQMFRAQRRTLLEELCMNTIQHVFIIGMLEAKADQLCNNNNNYAKNGGEKKIEGFDLPSYKKIRSPNIKTYLLVVPFSERQQERFGVFFYI